ncbi:MAG TPA: S8 family peptidase, partial [Chloroflexota bacterium]
MRTRPPLFALVLLLATLGPATVRAQILPPNPKISPALLTRMASNALALQPVIVEMEGAAPPFSGLVNVQRAQLALNLLTIYGQAVGGLPIVDAAAGWANAAGITAISLVPGVAYIHEDATVSPRRTTASGPAWPPGQLTSLYPREVKANLVWPQSQGNGVTVAVLDSGIAASPDLGNRVLTRVNFAGPKTTDDPGGHGSHVAGIVAGSGTLSQGEYVGIAPAAKLVDVRVIDENGGGRISSVVAGIGWALDHRQQYNIRVLNLSFGAPPLASYRADPMTAALEIAWKRGVAVVVAAGNSGPGSGTVHSPGYDPYGITVGATDDLGTLSLADDGLAWFSSWGTPAGGRPKPDVVAPGRKIVSLRVPGSTLDTLLADHVTPAANGASMFRLTGSSQATGVVSGTVALMLARTPSLTPDQVKAILVGTTQGYGPGGSPVLPDPTADGSGLLNAQAAYQSAARPSVNGGLRPSDAFARTVYPALYGQPLSWLDPNYLGIAWNTLTWDNIAWDNIAWDNIAWDNIAW